MRETGRMIKDLVLASKDMRMETSTLEASGIVRLMERENMFGRTETSMMVNGSWGSNKVMVNGRTKLERAIKVSGC